MNLRYLFFVISSCLLPRCVLTDVFLQKSYRNWFLPASSRVVSSELLSGCLLGYCLQQAPWIKLKFTALTVCLSLSQQMSQGRPQVSGEMMPTACCGPACTSALTLGQWDPTMPTSPPRRWGFIFPFPSLGRSGTVTLLSQVPLPVPLRPTG